MKEGTDSILVVKLSALGDFIQAFGPFQAIRRAHPQSRIVLLTTRPYGELAAASGWFDAVWIDDRPKAWQIRSVWALRRKLRQGGFRRVYDLQTVDRTAFYFRLMGGAKAVEWSGHAAGCSHPHPDPQWKSLHTLERHRAQLRAAGIAETPPPDLSWLKAPDDDFVESLGVKAPFALLVPGASAHRLDKRWPASCYAALAQRLSAQGIRPLVVGTDAEAAEAAAIQAACPAAANLLGRTSIAELATLGRQAWGAVGNDTGPMHLIAALGCPSVAVYSKASNPARCGQRGPFVRLLQRDSLADLAVDDVWAALAGCVEQKN